MERGSNVRSGCTCVQEAVADVVRIDNPRVGAERIQRGYGFQESMESGCTTLELRLVRLNVRVSVICSPKYAIA